MCMVVPLLYVSDEFFSLSRKESQAVVYKLKSNTTLNNFIHDCTGIAIQIVVYSLS